MSGKLIAIVEVLFAGAASRLINVTALLRNCRLSPFPLSLFLHSIPTLRVRPRSLLFACALSPSLINIYTFLIHAFTRRTAHVRVPLETSCRVIRRAEF